MSANASDARELARRIVASAASEVETPDAAALVAHQALERTYRSLARSFGPAGLHALLSRAIAQTQAQHPVVKELLIDRRSGPVLSNTTRVVATYGAPAVAAGLEAVLETLLLLLGRLIGDDMVTRLVEQSAAEGTPDDEDVA